jgi:hypothetical protein
MGNMRSFKNKVLGKPRATHFVRGNRIYQRTLVKRENTETKKEGVLKRFFKQAV